ncbi:MAG: ABC transporter permease [Caldilineaceae bacterium]
MRDPRLTAEAQEAIRVRFAGQAGDQLFRVDQPAEDGRLLRQPVAEQFFIYGNLLRGELGISYHTNRPVTDVLAERLWNTVLLIGVGQILAVILGHGGAGCAGGVESPQRRGLQRACAQFDGVELAHLLAGDHPALWGSTYFNLPLGGMITAGQNFATSWARTVDLLRHLALPTLTYTIVFLGEYMLIMRSSLLDVLSEDYILTAKAKGLSNFLILKDHALAERHAAHV